MFLKKTPSVWFILLCTHENLNLCPHCDMSPMSLFRFKSPPGYINLKQFYSAIIESVLCTSITHLYICLVQLSYQVWPQKTSEGSPDGWANHWYNPPHTPRTVLIQSEQKGCQYYSGPLTSSTRHLWCYRALSTRTTRHRNSIFPQAIHLMNTWH